MVLRVGGRRLTRPGLALVAITAVVCAPTAWADTYVLGGTNQIGAPTQPQMRYLIDDGYVAPDTMIGIDYPAQLWPLSGTMALDPSVRAGTEALAAIVGATNGAITVVGTSQGAVVINYEKQRLAASGSTRNDILFVTIADPTNSDGGIMGKLAPGYLPILDFTLTPPPPETPNHTLEVVREYDGVADWPDKPLNALAAMNAFAGGVYLHSKYGGLDLDDPDNVVTTTPPNSLGGTTTHIVVHTEQLPLTQPLRDAGVDDRVVDAIDKPLRKIINRAYDGPRPGRPEARKPGDGLRTLRDKIEKVRSKIAERHANRTRAAADASPSDKPTSE